VITVWGEDRQEGVWLVPESPGAANLLIVIKRGYRVDPDARTSFIEVPNFIEPNKAGWRIRFADKQVRLIDFETKQVLPPPKMLVQVRRSAGERGLDSSIQRESIPCLSNVNK